jgi:hypothetical protein
MVALPGRGEWVRPGPQRRSYSREGDRRCGVASRGRVSDRRGARPCCHPVDAGGAHPQPTSGDPFGLGTLATWAERRAPEANSWSASRRPVQTSSLRVRQDGRLSSLRGTGLTCGAYGGRNTTPPHGSPSGAYDRAAADNRTGWDPRPWRPRISTDPQWSESHDGPDSEPC